MRAATAAIIGIVVLSSALSWFFYNDLPDTMASHWNASGNADGFMPKLLAVSLMPVISVLLLLLFVALPRLDPLKKNVNRFRAYYDGFIAAVMAFLLYIHALAISYGLGSRLNFVQAMVPAFAAIVFLAGILIGESERNWFIGIRTPWTMSSDRVWKKTHRLGGRLFKLTAAITLLGLVLTDYAIYLLLVPLMLSVAISFAYSYFEYKKKH